ncbi:MAG: CHRD domain-containing protein [Chloroflexi bacterium]|nr:CHRD domain-containing protein [Chloroflexota bacterium]
MKRPVAGVLALALFALFASLAAAQGPLKLTMNAQNNSGQNGSVTLTAKGDQTDVLIDIAPGAAGVAQPAHIHDGTCANLGGVKYPLTNVTEGKSTTTVNVDLATLEKGTYAVNVHKSPQEVRVYVSCADITVAGGASALPKTGDALHPGLILGALALGLLTVSAGLVLSRRAA